MVGRKKFRCFIASAIGKDDVDSLLDECIAPVLARNQSVPVRVDRVPHNDDIDDKIIELIESVDFCIADLSYARPSVYFEAGIAEGRGTPVIYTVRADHLDPQFVAKHSELRVHFDLQMKNIIDWDEPTDVFSSRLSEMVENVILPPLRRQREADESLRNDRAEFASMSIKEKSALLVSKVEKAFLERGYKQDSAAPRGLRFEKGSSPDRTRVTCVLHRSMTKQKLGRLFMLTPHTRIEPPLKEHHVFVLLLNQLRRTTVQSHPLFANFRIHELGAFDGTYGGARLVFHFLDNPKSGLDFENRLAKHLEAFAL